MLNLTLGQMDVNAQKKRTTARKTARLRPAPCGIMPAWLNPRNPSPKPCAPAGSPSLGREPARGSEAVRRGPTGHSQSPAIEASPGDHRQETAVGRRHLTANGATEGAHLVKVPLSRASGGPMLQLSHPHLNQARHARLPNQSA